MSNETKAAPAVPVGNDPAWTLAAKVREALDRKACPGYYMDVAVEAVVHNYTPAAPSQGPVTDEEKQDLVYEKLSACLHCGAQSQEPALHIGACITNGVLHATVMRREANGHVTILATAEMDAKSLLEHDCVAKLSPAAPSQGPVTDEYAGVIAWVGDKQCKRVITEGAIKHEHTPGVAMRNAAHQCVQEVIITAQREKDGK